MTDQISDHPLACIFPLLEGLQFRELVEDIRVNGLREAVVLFEGAILDGRNRARTCHAAQVPVRFRSYDGRDPLAFVVSANLHRRHLDASQRAMIAAELVELKHVRGRPKKDGRRDRGGRLLPPLKCPKRPHRKRMDPTPAAGTLARRLSPLEAGKLLNVSDVLVRLPCAFWTKGQRN